MKINFGIVAAIPHEDEGTLELLHFCGYEEPPSQQAMDHLAEELNTDPAFNLVGRIGKDVKLFPATPEMVTHYKALFEIGVDQS
jgi:hypothetical protein